MSFDAKQAIAAGIKALREENPEPTDQLAALLDVGPATVYRWQNGTTTPDADDLYALAAHYGTTMDDVIARGRTALAAGDKEGDRPRKKRPPDLTQRRG